MQSSVDSFYTNGLDIILSILNILSIFIRFFDIFWNVLHTFLC